MKHKLRIVTALLFAALESGFVSAQTQVPSAASQSVAPNAQAATIMLSFQNADVAPVAAAVAKAVGQSIIVDPRVKGKITLTTPKPVTAQTALDMFSSALRSASFALVQVNGMYRVVPDADARVQGNTVLTQNNQEGDQVVTRVFKIKQDSATNLVNVLRPLLTQNSSITANPGNNTLIVTDYASNVKRVAKLLESMDEPSIGDMQGIHLRYAIAIDVASILTKMVDNSGAGHPPGTDSKVVIIAEPRSNSILIQSSNPEKIRQLRGLVAKLDSPSASNGNMWVVPLKNAEASKLAVTLRAIVAADSSLSQQAGATNAGSAMSAMSNTTTSSSPMQAASQAAGLIAGAAGAQGAAGGSAAATSALTSTSQPNVGGLIQADMATNSLIITASETFYRNLREVIEKLDRRRTQVYVEALIVEVNATTSAQLGIQWQGLINSGGQNVPFGGTNYTPPTGVNVVNLSQSAECILNPVLCAGKTATTLAGSQGLNIGTLSKFGGSYTVSALISALEKDGGARVLSTPNLVTLDNEEARIMVGQNVPILSGGYTTNTGGQSSTGSPTPFQTFNRQDVGVLLRVRPQISNNGTVKLTVYQEVSSVPTNQPNAATQGYTINKRMIESNVIVDDGQMFVIGGLIGDNYYDSSDGVPFLMNIPLIGQLFRYDSKTREKTNLMVFLRPYVVKDRQAAEELTSNRSDFIQEKQDNFKQSPMLLPKENLPTMNDSTKPLTSKGPNQQAPTLTP